MTIISISEGNINQHQDINLIIVRAFIYRQFGVLSRNRPTSRRKM